MDTLAAFTRGEANRGKQMRVFDWDRAARMIREQHAHHAAAGLSGDWEYTGGDIFDHGTPVDSFDTYTYLASTWAVPELSLDGEIVECWVWQNETNWDSGTYWPDSARKILNGEIA